MRHLPWGRKRRNGRERTRGRMQTSGKALHPHELTERILSLFPPQLLMMCVIANPASRLALHVLAASCCAGFVIFSEIQILDALHRAPEVCPSMPQRLGRSSTADPLSQVVLRLRTVQQELFLSLSIHPSGAQIGGMDASYREALVWHGLRGSQSQLTAQPAKLRFRIRRHKLAGAGSELTHHRPWLSCRL